MPFLAYSDLMRAEGLKRIPIFWEHINQAYKFTIGIIFFKEIVWQNKAD